jgi:hypothetical protein
LENSDLASLFKSLIDDGSLIKVQDGKGNTFEDLGTLGGWTNNIGNLMPGKGYKVKVKNESQLDFVGTPSIFPLKIPLETGWNIIGYPKSSEADAQLVVKQLIDRGTLIKVQDEKGNSLEEWGKLMGWKNNIGNFIAGKGYKIKVRSKDTLTIYESYSKGALTDLYEMKPTIHFLPAFEGNGVDHMNINLIGLYDGLLNIGDELAVFDGAVCVGAVNLQDFHLTNQTVSIPVSATDNIGLSGFSDGNPIILKLWKTKTDKEYIISPEIVNGSSTFIKHETTLASLEKLIVNVFDNEIQKDELRAKCYPNPFSDEISIEVYQPESTGLSVSVFAQDGKIIKQLVKHNQVSQGLQIFRWNGTNNQNMTVPSGIYFLKIRTDKNEINQKIVLYK